MKAKSELDSVQLALAVVREARRKAEEEIFHLTDERLSLIMELGAGKEELSAFQAKATMERKAMEEEFDSSSNVIFNYGYGCYAFAHNICESKPMIPAGCLIRQSRYLHSFLSTTNAPQVLSLTFLLPQLLGRNPRPTVL